jgi:hypothetical protein
MKEMPLYTCHKTVRALQVAQVKAVLGHPQYAPEGTKLLVFADESYEPVQVGPEWVVSHRPVVGGYFVQYSDGYTSFSPQLAFEDGYSLSLIPGSGSERWEHHGWTEAGDGTDYPGEITSQPSGPVSVIAPVAIPTQAQADAVAAKAAAEQKV